MNRFSQEHTPHDIRRRLVPSVVLTLGCVLFLWKFSSSVTETTNYAQMENLKQAILRSAVHCYAVEPGRIRRRLRGFQLQPPTDRYGD